MSEDANLLLVLLSGSVVLEHLLGVDLLVALTRKVDVAIRLATAALTAAVAVVVLAHLGDRLLMTTGAGWLGIPMTAYAALGGVLVAGVTLRRAAPRTFVALRSYYPLLAGNGLMLGIALASAPVRPLSAALGRGVALAGSFCIVLVVFGYVAQRLSTSDVPRALRGAPILMISLGVLALGFQGFGR